MSTDAIIETNELTKLYNRFSFDERLEHAVAHADRFEHKVALLLIDLGAGRNRLGGSALAQVYGRIGREVPDLDTPAHQVAISRDLGQHHPVQFQVHVQHPPARRDGRRGGTGCGD